MVSLEGIDRCIPGTKVGHRDDLIADVRGCAKRGDGVARGRVVGVHADILRTGRGSDGGGTATTEEDGGVDGTCDGVDLCVYRWEGPIFSHPPGFAYD